MTEILLKNFALLDVHSGALRSGFEVLVRGREIAAVEEGAIAAPEAEVVDLGGRTLMPGLIDCHVHAIAPVIGSGKSGYPTKLPSLVHAGAGDVLRRTLMRGFTTIRDCAGADLGHKQAVEQGLFTGPRMFVSGKALSQTGGHGDFRNRADLTDPCAFAHLGIRSCRVADGVADVQKAVRDELRLGADQIKIMAGGGVVSDADPIDHVQYGRDEIAAIVDEAGRSHTYVSAHAYTSECVSRAVELGVRTIEHGNMIDEATAKLMARAGAYLVPTLVVYQAMKRHAAEMGRSVGFMTKLDDVMTYGTRMLEIARAAGVKMAYGTDLADMELVDYQAEEFLIRAEVLGPAEVIRSATVIGAEVVRMEGRLGVVAAGACADLLVVDGDPLDDVGLFQNNGEHLAAIMKDGQFFKNRIAPTSVDAPAPKSLEPVA